MAKPAIVAQRLYEYGTYEPRVIIVSAPGKDEEYPEKITDLLLSYEQNPTDIQIERIQRRIHQISKRSTHLDSQQIDAIVENVPSDIEQFINTNKPVSVLGEYWSARLFAQSTHHSQIKQRTYIDPANVIRFDNEGNLMIAESCRLIAEAVQPENYYILPGYYGADEQGRIRTLGRGGSDTSGALVALALRAHQYHNWSDVNGFYNHNPRHFEDAQLIEHMSYNQALEFALRGCELLHRDAISMLAHTTVQSVMRNTFNSTNGGTLITPESTELAV